MYSISNSRSRWLFFLFLTLALAGCVQTFDQPAPTPRTAPPAKCQLHLNGGTISGGCWDGGAKCNAPDPFIQLYVNGQPTFRTSVQAKTFKPTWNERAALTKDQISHALIVLYDQDGKAKQRIAQWRVRLDWILDNPGDGMIVGAQATNHAAHLDLAIRCQTPNGAASD